MFDSPLDIRTFIELPALLLLFIEPAIDLRDLCHPALPITMFQRKDLLVRPMKMKCKVRYLLMEPL